MQTGSVLQRVQSTQTQVIQMLTGNAAATSGLLKFQAQAKGQPYDPEAKAAAGGAPFITSDQVYDVLNKLITCEKLMDSLHVQTVVKG
jgi:hypothetical protein